MADIARKRLALKRRQFETIRTVLIVLLADRDFCEIYIVIIVIDLCGESPVLITFLALMIRNLCFTFILIQESRNRSCADSQQVML